MLFLLKKTCNTKKRLRDHNFMEHENSAKYESEIYCTTWFTRIPVRKEDDLGIRKQVRKIWRMNHSYKFNLQKSKLPRLWVCYQGREQVQRSCFSKPYCQKTLLCRAATRVQYFSVLFVLVKFIYSEKATKFQNKSKTVKNMLKRYIPVKKFM